MMEAEDAALLLNRGKERFGVSQKSIQIGAQADLTLFTAYGITNRFERVHNVSFKKQCLFR